MLTKQQREERRLGIGSSDTPALFGEDPYKSMMDVWVEKTQAVEEHEQTDDMEKGNLLEPVLVRWAANELWLSKDLLENVQDQSKDLPILRANADGVIARSLVPESVIEAKVVGAHASTLRQWDTESGEVPTHVLLQCHHLMRVFSVQVAWVPALILSEMHLFKVERDEALIQGIEAVAVNFWNNHVRTGTPPPNQPLPASVEVLRRVKRVPNKVVAVTQQDAVDFINAKIRASDAKKEVEIAQAKLMQTMGDAEVGEWERGRFEFFKQSRRAYTVAESTMRVFRHKEKKE